MIKKVITVSAILALTCCFFGCKSDEEKCKDGDLDACQKALSKAADNAQKELEKAQKDLGNIKLP